MKCLSTVAKLSLLLALSTLFGGDVQAAPAEHQVQVVSYGGHGHYQPRYGKYRRHNGGYRHHGSHGKYGHYRH